jgi:hypothetical protein
VVADTVVADAVVGAARWVDFSAISLGELL